LPAGSGAPAKDLTDLFERDLKYVVENEGRSLGRGQPVEHDHQSHPDRVIECHTIGGIARRSLVLHQRFRPPWPDIRLPLDPGRSEMVETQSARHGDQPALGIVDFVDVLTQ